MIEWNIIRAAGVGAFLMLWASVAWGLVATTSEVRQEDPETDVHRLAPGVLDIRMVPRHAPRVPLADRFMPFGPLDLVIPMRATRPIGVTLGIASMFVLVLGVLSTSWGSASVSYEVVAAQALALMHALMTGTDSKHPAMFWMCPAVGRGILLFLLLLRGLNSQRAQRATLPEGAARKRRGNAGPAADAIAERAPRPRPMPPSRSLLFRS